MIYAPSLRAPFVPDAEGTQEPKLSFFTLLIRALRESRELEAERIVALMIEQRGGRMTDDLERRISDRLSPVESQSFGR